MSAHRCSVANLEALVRGTDFKSSNGNINWKLTRRLTTLRSSNRKK